MSWFKKAATDDGGLNVSKSPNFSGVWKIRREKGRKKNVRKKKFA